MDQKAIIQLVSKSLGLYFIVQSVFLTKELIIHVTNARMYGDETSYYIYMEQIIFNLLVYLFTSWVLIARSAFVSDKLIKKTDKVELNIPKVDLLEIVIITIGGLAIVNAVPEILAKLTQYLYFNEFGKEDKDIFWNEKQRKADIVFSIFKFVVGLFVITNKNAIANRLMKIDSQTGSE